MRLKDRTRENIDGYIFIAPLIVYFTVFQILPMLLALYYSFTEWNLFHDPQWVGLENYIKLFTDTLTYPRFYPSIWITVKYALFTIPASVLLTTLVSAILTTEVRGERFFKTMFYIPSVTVGVAVTAMWMFMLDPLYGMINQLLGTEINFLGNEKTALGVLCVMSVWSGLGYNVLIMSAAMKNIDPALYEAADVDGAGFFTKFWRITLPSIRPTLNFIVVTGIIGAFQVFDQVYFMTGGGPVFSTYTYMFGVYNQAFDLRNVGTACAMSYILFLIILLITFLQNKLMPDDTTARDERRAARKALREARKGGL